MKSFETSNPEIIKLYEDYRFLKYYKENVLDDIRRQYENRVLIEGQYFNTELTIEEENKMMMEIETFLNKSEMNRFVEIMFIYNVFQFRRPANIVLHFYVCELLAEIVISNMKKELYEYYRQHKQLISLK
jgi:hypothetical protein